MPSSEARNRSVISAISGEWKAWETGSSLTLTPRAVSCATTSSSEARPPETTQSCGVLSAPNERSAYGATSSATSSAGAATATMDPGARTDCIRAPRAATRRTASSSENSPATAAAATSPTEWPTSTSGRIPQLSQSLARAYSREKSAGWVNRVWSRSPGSPSSPNMSALTERPRCAAKSRSQASRCSRKTGWRAYSGAPMPVYCAPWPVNSSATLRSGSAVGSWSRSASSSSRSPTTPAIRWPKWARPSVLVRQTSSRPRSGWSSRCRR